MDPELFECPFCPPDLSKPAFVPYNDNVFSGRICWKVKCLECGCSTGEPENSKEAAADIWNTRTALTPEQFALAVHDGEIWVREKVEDGR